jgi:hypothetical protein
VAWISAIYPLLIVVAFYATWLTAWGVLGHRPRVNLDDPKDTGPVVSVPYVLTYLFLEGIPFSLLIPVPLLIAEVLRNHSRGIDRPLKNAVERFATPLVCGVLVWGYFFFIMLWDPLDVVKWYCR